MDAQQAGRIAKSLSRLVEVQTVSREDERGRLPGEKCDYQEFGLALSREARERGLYCGHIGGRLGNWILKFPNEDREKQVLLLVVHADTVPAGNLKEWKTKPFSLSVQGDLAYGRGASDCKSGIIVGFEAMYRLILERSSKVNVRLLICRDEEIGSREGILHLVKEGLLKADAALVLDTKPVIVTAASGVIGASIGFEGSAERAVSIFNSVIDFGGEREAKESEYLVENPRRKLWGRVTPTILDLGIDGSGPGKVRGIFAGGKTNVIPESCLVEFGMPVSDWEGFFEGIKGGISQGYEIKSLQPGLIEIRGKGGHAAYPQGAKNPIPEAVRLVEEGASGIAQMRLGIDARVLPEEDISEVKRGLVLALKDGAGSEAGRVKLNEGKWTMHPPCRLEKSPASSAFLAQVKEVFGAHGLLMDEFGDLGALDATALLGAGIPSISCGPQNESIHQPNENVSLEMVGKFSDMVVDLCRNWKRV